MKKVIVFLIAFSVMIGLGYFAWAQRRQIAERVLGIQSSGEKWSASKEVRALIRVAEGLDAQRRAQEKSGQGQASRQGRSYVPVKLSYPLEKTIAQFPAADILKALERMKPSVATYVIPEIKDPETKRTVLEKLDPKQLEDIQDWVNLRRQQEQLAAEMSVLEAQKRRMELFQSSLVKQQKSLSNMLVVNLQTLKELQQLQEKLDAQFLTIAANEKKNLLQIAQIYDEMEPKDVVEVLENEKGIDERTFVKVLSMMEKDQAAEVLGSLKPEMAARFTDALRLLRKEQDEAQSGFSSGRRPFKSSRNRPRSLSKGASGSSSY